MAFNCGDPEGIAFDYLQGVLLIVDGVNSEVYRVDPGSNGAFDGVPPAGDDQVTHFDTESEGIHDLEGAGFNPINGNIYVVGRPASIMAEFTTSGVLVQIIDISAANAYAPAGLAYAPGSLDQNSRSIYITDRGIDNSDDPEENDGKIYELSMPPMTPVPPVANDDIANTLPNTLITVDVAANDIDPNGNLDPASANTTCTSCSEPTNGSLLNNGDGTFDYTPNLDFNGSDSFVYEIWDSGSPVLTDTATVTITIESVNDPPVVNENYVSTLEDTAVTFDVAANDSDPDGNLNPASTNTTCSSCSEPVHGNLVNNGDGTFDYTPNSNFNGSDSFVYQICDSGSPVLCDIATVTIIIYLVNDPPVVNENYVSTLEDTAVTFDVAANDSDPDGNLDPTSTNTACTSCSEPVHGNLVNNGDGTFDYTPNSNFNGSDSFVYQICDSGSPVLCDIAIVSITVNPINDPPVANDDSASTSEDTAVTVDVTANDSDLDGTIDPTSTNTTCTSCSEPSNGSLLNNGDGTFDYIPDLDFNGYDGFVYQICDSGSPVLCDIATVSITVDPVADPPVATDDSASTAEDTAVTVDVAANDSDPDGNLDPTSTNNTCTSCSEPTNGSLLNNGDGTFNYTPDLNFNGSDSFVYQICDSGSPVLCDTASVTVIVDAVNDPPVANDDSASTPEDTAVTVDVAANDSDLDGNLDPTSTNNTCASCSEPSNGSLVNNGNGSFTYSPDLDFNGLDSFVYQICDTELLCDTGIVTISITDKEYIIFLPWIILTKP
jgi:hypothetical protein